MNTENKTAVADVNRNDITDHTEITYTQVGDYLLPNLTLDPQPEGEIGVWGWRRKMYLKERRKGTYNAMLMKGTLTQHLACQADGGVRGRDRGSQAPRSDGMGRGYEQHPQPRR